MAQLQVILLERIESLGQMGDVVRVKLGFARNFLLPQKKALRATKDNIAYFESRRAQLEADNLKLRGEAEAVAARMKDARIVVIRQAGETGQLYGSVNAKDAADGLTAAGYTIQKRQVVIDRPIKAIGIHTVRVVLHPEVSVNVLVNVGQSEDEAKLQQERFDRGEQPVVLKAEAEAAETALVAAPETAPAAPAAEAQPAEPAAKPEGKKKSAKGGKAQQAAEAAAAGDEKPAKKDKKSKK
jgi:large subunit ribosomal protein L9